MPDQPPGDLLILLHDVARLIRITADRRARAHGMTRAQWMILVWVHRRGGLTQRELAEILEVEPITVGRLVDRLEGRGFVERRADPRDRRCWRLHLTPAAAPMLAEIDATRRELDMAATRGLPPALREATLIALKTMKQNLIAADDEDSEGLARHA